MKNRIEKRINRLLKRFNIVLVGIFPRHAVRFAKKHFGNRPLTIVEIGTFEGKHAESILKELKTERFFVVDPYDDYSDYAESEPRTVTRLKKAQEKAKERLKDYSDKITWIKKNSDKAVSDIPDDLDFVYIDGNHEYEYVLKDMENYYNKLKTNGILAGHDITHERFNKDVFKALKEFSNKYNVDPYVSRTDWWIVKG